MHALKAPQSLSRGTTFNHAASTPQTGQINNVTQRNKIQPILSLLLPNEPMSSNEEL